MNALKIGEFFGVFGNMQKWLQGKKTYTVNTVQALAGVSAMLIAAGNMAEVASQTVGLFNTWIAGSQSLDATLESIKALWSQHTALIAGFSAAFYAIADAISKMTNYAGTKRMTEKKEGK